MAEVAAVKVRIHADVRAFKALEDWVEKMDRLGIDPSDPEIALRAGLILDTFPPKVEVLTWPRS